MCRNGQMCMIRYLLMFLFSVVTIAHAAAAEPIRVLWWNGTPDYPPEFNASHRKSIVRYLTEYEGGSAFEAAYQGSTQGGALASHLGTGQNYDVLILDLTDARGRLNQADLSAIQNFYGSGRRALMFDGSLYIRSNNGNQTTKFPGINGSSAGLLVNQITAIANEGGGILVGTDHDQFQTSANLAVGALLPGAAFTGYTNPSTDGNFIGETLLGERVAVTARDILRHWESVPSQGEAPVGQFTDFMGQPVTLYTLVETADKPGGGRKRPYISASFDPGSKKTAIDAETSVFDKMPTRRGP